MFHMLIASCSIELIWFSAPYNTGQTTLNTLEHYLTHNMYSPRKMERLLRKLELLLMSAQSALTSANSGCDHLMDVHSAIVQIYHFPKPSPTTSQQLGGEHYSVLRCSYFIHRPATVLRQISDASPPCACLLLVDMQ